MCKIPSRGLIALFLIAAVSISMITFNTKATAGQPSQAAITDTESPILVGYWDLRDRESFFQVTNTTGENHRVHIQVFDVNNGCAEFDYFDTLTPRDTHVYNVAELDRNNGVELSAPDLTGGHGIVAITHVDGGDELAPEPVLTGNFRINDNDGYRYSTNLAGVTFAKSISSPLDSSVNFNNVDGSEFADLVVIGLDFDTNPGGVMPVDQDYNFRLFDDQENPISCPGATLGCQEGVINVGVNETVTNSRGGPSVCLGSDSTGFLEIETEVANPEAYVIFMGLNNGNGTGSVDSAIFNSPLLVGNDV